MTSDDIICMAREAGFVEYLLRVYRAEEGVEKLARAAYERGVAAERQRLRSLYESTMAPATLYDPRGSLGEPIV